MDNDLISRSALKEDLLKLWDYSTVDGITASTVLKQVLHDIDNAPTVAVNCKDCDGYEAGYSAGYKDDSSGADWRCD